MDQAKPYCKECVFATVDDKSKQTGCRTGRLDKFIEIGEAYMSPDSDYYVLPQFCNMMRPKEWAEKIAEHELDEIEVVEDQIVPIIGVCVRDNGEIEELDETVESLLEIEYESPKLKIVLSSDGTGSVARLANLITRLQTKWKNSEVIFHLVDITKVKETEVFQKIAGAPYFIYINAGQKVHKDFLNTINESLNEKLERIVVFEKDGVCAVRGSVMRQCYLDFEDYNKALEFLIYETKKQGVYKEV